MNLFEVVAKIRLDSDDYDKKLSKESSKLSKIGSAIGGAAKTVGAASAAAIGAGATAVAGLAKQAVSAYSEYEQLKGGVETLFGTQGQTLEEFAKTAKATASDIESSGIDWSKYADTAWMTQGGGISGLFDEIQYNIEDLKTSSKELEDYLYFEYDLSTEDAQAAIQAYYNAVSQEGVTKKFESMEKAQEMVLKNADNAYKTAGLSANEYMETVTSFAASLTSSLDGNTEKAAWMADRAITDMADNANKMGTSMESIQNAYQGFAKQNYTMLDNLKLGYGGTKEEMARLLEDAEKLEGYQLGTFDISNFADIVEAINIVQSHLGITGTTAKEAASTIQGSLGMMKSSWQNLIAGLGKEDVNLDELIDNFVSALETLGDNIFPIVEKTLEGIGKLVSDLLPKLGQKLPGILQKVLPGLLNGVTKLLTTIANDLPRIIQIIVPPLVQALIQVAAAIIKNLPQILKSVGTALLTALKTIFKSVGEGLKQVAPGLFKALETAWETVKIVFSKAGEFFKKVWEAIKGVFSVAVSVIGGFFKGAWNAVKSVWNGAKKFFQGIWDGIQLVFTVVADVLGGFFSTAWDIIKGVWDAVTGFFQKIWDGIKAIFEPVADTIGGFFSTAWDGIKFVWDTVVGFFQDVWDGIKKVFSGVATFFSDAFDGFISVLSSIADWLVKIAEGAKEAVKQVLGIKEEASQTPEWSMPTYRKKSKAGMPSNIPGHAEGGVFYRPTLGIFGEAGAEAVVPLDQNKRWIHAVTTELVSQIGSVGLASGAGGDIIIPVYIGQNRIEEIIVSAQQRTNYRSGGRA